MNFSERLKRTEAMVPSDALANRLGDAEYQDMSANLPGIRDPEHEDYPLHTAVGAYQENAEGVNNHLRGQPSTRGDWEGQVRNLDRAFQKHGMPLDNDTYVYRAMAADHLGDQDLNGMDLHDPAFLSTTTSLGHAVQFLKNMNEWSEGLFDDLPIAMMRIKVPKGSPVVIPDRHAGYGNDLAGSQRELLINRGARLRVRQHQTDPDRMHHFIDAELIGHE